MAKNAAASKVTPFQAVRADIEIEAGIFAMPFSIEEAGAAPYHPEMLIWMVPNGPVLGQELDRPGALLDRAGSILRAALRSMPFLPGTLRVESPELAAALRPQISSRIELICAPTPALTEVVGLLESSMKPRFSYLAGGVDPDDVAVFFRAAAKMLRARPWTAIPKDQVVGITIEALAMHNQALLLYPPSRDSRGGWLLGEDLEEVEIFLEQVERRQAGDEVDFPPVHSFLFEERKDFPERLMEEIRSHGWEMGAECPWVATMMPDGDFAAPSKEDFAVGTAVAEVLVQAMAQAGALKKALTGKGPPLTVRTRVVLFGEEEVEVVLEAPYVEPGVLARRPDHPLLGALYDLEVEEIPDYRRRKKLEKELLAQFSATASGKEWARLEWLTLVLDIAADYLGSTAASIDGDGLSTIFLEIFPRSVVVSPTEAERVVAECAGFFRFLADDCGHQHARSCVGFLNAAGLVADLRSAWSDRSKGGIGKQLMTSGAAAGFDLETPGGIRSWLEQVQEKGLPEEIQKAFPMVESGPKKPPRRKK